MEVEAFDSFVSSTAVPAICCTLQQYKYGKQGCKRLSLSEQA